MIPAYIFRASGPAVSSPTQTHASIARTSLVARCFLDGGHIDHVHLAVGLSRTLSISKLIEKIKTETSRWAKDVEGGDPNFSWQSGYGVFSISHSNLEAVKHYIETQEDHHAKRSFQDEFRLMCEKHGIEIDERYVWD